MGNCEVVVCTHSSLISSAVIQKKKILSIQSKFLGNYVTQLANKYKNSLRLYSINIDEPIEETKKNLNNEMKNSYKYYDEYVKTRLLSDGDNDPYKKITKIIKKIYFK